MTDEEKRIERNRKIREARAAKKAEDAKNGSAESSSNESENSEDSSIAQPFDRLDAIYREMQKEFGEEEVMIPAFMSEDDYPKVEWIPLSSPKISDLCGRGLPRGRHIEFYGKESSGKTSLACYVAGQVQAVGGIVAYVDVEQALDLEYAKTFGLDVDHMLFSQPSSGEKALDIVESYVRKNIDLVIVDSVAMLVPQAEIDGEMGDAHMALQGRLMSKGLRKITSAMKNSPTTILWINQVRAAPGQWAPHGMVPETTTGGYALKFFATIRIEVKKKELEMNKDGEGVAQIVRLKAVKNKVAPPMRVREITIRFGEGVEMTRDWFDYAVVLGVIQRRGGGHLFPDGHKESSGDKAWAYFKEMLPGEREKIISSTKMLIGKKAAPVVITQETVEQNVEMTTRVSDAEAKENEGGEDETAEN